MIRYLPSPRAAVAVAVLLVTPTGSATPQGAMPATRAPTLACTAFSYPQRTQRSFAVDPTDDRILYVGVEQDGFFKSTDGGATWVRASVGLKAWGRSSDPTRPCFEEFYETTINPKNPQQLCIVRAGSPGTTSTPSSAGANGVYCSDDGAATWTQRITPAMNTATLTIAADPTDFRTLYVGVNGGPCSNTPPVCAPGTYFNTRGAIYRTTDAGATWTELEAQYVPDMRVVAVRADERNPQVLLAATFAKLPGGSGAIAEAAQRGVLRSTDGGRTWSASLAGLGPDPREQALLELGMAPRNGMRVFATASSNASYWSDDGGVTFHRVQRIAVFAFDPHDGAGRHLLGANDDAIVESRDGGRTWNRKAALPTAFSRQGNPPSQLAWSRTNAAQVFLSGPRATVFASADGGATWRQILSAERLPP